MLGLTRSFYCSLFFTCLFKIADSHLGTKGTPLGGSLFLFDRIDLLKRQDGNIDLGSDCGGDAACSTTDYGCECRFADDSWANDLPNDDPPPDAPTPVPPPPPPTPKNDPVDPPGKLNCEPTPSKNPKDSHKEKMSMAAESFCNRYAKDEDQDPASLPITKTLFVWGHSTDDLFGDWIDEVVDWKGGNDSEDDVYDFKIELVDDCATDKVNLGKPVANNDCASILKSAWQQCNNKGRGGSLVAGCLTYSIVTKF